MAEFYTAEKKSLILKKEEEDFQEDVWGVMKERESSTSSNLKVKKAAKENSLISSASASACKNIPAFPRRVNNLQQQLSAPLNISDDQWSKIYNTSKKSSDTNKNSWDDDLDDDEEMVPPHEFIARRLARNPVVSFSMCEGIGRTLKGRDLSNLRNAILTMTGFLE
ncbi:hypothetical protein ACH5RR_017610 [Cinchona calisaya]|uniref:Uncharacterized protein n=1 Tax=Cinchona calisaya TaxID=153742 RepID=A0ABD2ZKT2_9GENT